MRAALLVALLLASGCARYPVARSDGHPTDTDLESRIVLHRTPLSGVGGYFKARLYDLADILGVTLMAGLGIDLNVRATQLGQVGGGGYDAHRIGFVGRFPGYWRERRREVGFAFAYAHKLKRRHMHGPVTCYHPNGFPPRPETLFLPGARDRTADEIGVTAFAGIVGFDAYVRPVELVDFLLGLFGLDIRDDDYSLRLESTQVDHPVK